MTPHFDIDAFLAELRERLPGDAGVRDRIVAEAEDHLGEAVERLQAGGIAAAEAERQAIAKFGTPSEIAQSYSAQQEQREEGRVRLFAGWRALAAAVGLVILGFVGRTMWKDGAADVTQRTENRLQIQKAFTATRHLKIFDISGVERGAGTVVDDFRGDGSKAKWSRGQVAGPSRQPERVQFRTVDDRVADVYAAVLPGHRLISSHRLPQEDEPGAYLWSVTAPKRCSILLSALEADKETARDNILGYEVLKHNYGWAGTSLEAWVAPELDCYELRSTVWRVDAETGVKYVGAVNDVVTVTEGEPEGNGFALPEDYRETRPSELARVAKKMVETSGWAFSQAMFVLPDEQYHSLRGTTR